LYIFLISPVCYTAHPFILAPDLMSQVWFLAEMFRNFLCTYSEEMWVTMWIIPLQFNKFRENQLHSVSPNSVQLCMEKVWSLQSEHVHFAFVLWISFESTLICFCLQIVHLQGRSLPVWPGSGGWLGPNLPHLCKGSSSRYHTSIMNHHVCLRLLMHFSVNHSVLYNMAWVTYYRTVCVFCATLFQIWVCQKMLRKSSAQVSRRTSSK
jgi:hypothetical protein